MFLLICKSKIAKIIVELSFFAVVFRIDKYFDSDLVELDNNKIENCFEFEVFAIQNIVENCVFFFDNTLLRNKFL